MTTSLFSPFQLGEMKLDNRVVLSPMCQYAAENGCASDWHMMHLGQFAVAGLGLMMTEMTNVEARGRITANCMGLYDDDCEAAFARVVEFCRSLGPSPIAVQLAHAGRKASSLPPWMGRRQLGLDEGGWETVGPSAIAHKADARPPRELTPAEIDGLVASFADAARRAQRVGFDAIELHAAHGYLLHQFLSPLANRREDDYGGSRENRWRFPLRVFDAVRETWPQNKPLGVRLSAIDWAEGGLTLEDSVAFACELKAHGCDWIDVSSGGISDDEAIETGPAYQVPFADRIREASGVATMAVGMITEPRQAEVIVDSGQADLVALARALLFNPRWVWHAALQLGAEVEYPDRYKRCAPVNMNPF